MTLFFDPDSPPSFDLAEVEHDLTGARDVAYVNDLARRITPPRAPGLDRADPATSLAWIGGFLCIVIAIAACGLGVLVCEVARHWRGALELLTLGCIATGLLRGRR